VYRFSHMLYNLMCVQGYGMIITLQTLTLYVRFFFWSKSEISFSTIDLVP